MGLFQKWLVIREARGLPLGEDKAPDYSLDRWVKAAQDLGGNIDSMVKDAKGKEKDLEDEEEKAKKKAVEADKEADKADKDDEETTLDITKDKEMEGSWKRLKQIAKERREKEKESEESEKNS